MGRNKIVIQPITNERNRQATFTKRKNGLVKKAMELSILCGCDVALLVVLNNKLFEYSSKDLNSIISEYNVLERNQPLSNDDYDEQFSKKPATRKRRSKNDDDQDDRDDQSPPSPNSHTVSLGERPGILPTLTNTTIEPDTSSYARYSLNTDDPGSEYSCALTPRTAHKYQIANKKYEDLLNSMNSESQSYGHPSLQAPQDHGQQNEHTVVGLPPRRPQPFTTPSYESLPPVPRMQPTMINRSTIDSVVRLTPEEEIGRRSSEGMLHSGPPRSVVTSTNQPATLASSLTGVKRKARAFDPKQLTITVPKLAHKENRVPVPVPGIVPLNQDQFTDNQERAIPQLSQPSQALPQVAVTSFQEPPKPGGYSSHLQSNANQYSLLDIPSGMSPLPMTPGTFSVPQWPWTPSPRSAIPTRPSFLNFGIEPPSLKRRKISD